MVHFQSMAAALGSGECSLRLSAPSTACRSRCSSFFLTSSTTAATTIRAVSLVRSGMRPLSDISVPTSWMFGCTLLSVSGSNRSCVSPFRSMASAWMTETTSSLK